MRKKTTIRFTEQEKDLIKKVADFLGFTYTEVIRRSLRFGLNSLLKFETNKKTGLAELLNPKKPDKDDQQNDKPKTEEETPPGYNPPQTPEEEAELQRLIEIAKTPLFEDD